MKPSYESLTILLLVRNAQATLCRDVERLIEAAAELSTSFDLMIVDDGSRDATEEIAWELTTRYSQVQMVRQARPLGMMAAFRAALVHTSGEFVLVHEGTTEIRAEDLAILWRQRNQTGSKRETKRGGRLAEVLATIRDWWLPADEDSSTAGGLRLVRRAELAKLDPLAAEHRPNFLQRDRRRRSLSTR